MDTPAQDGFVLHCDGHEYAAHVRDQGDADNRAGTSLWWVLIDQEERRSPVLWDPNESRTSVESRLCDWLRSGAAASDPPR